MESAGSAGSNMLPAASKGWLNKTRETRILASSWTDPPRPIGLPGGFSGR